MSYNPDQHQRTIPLPADWTPAQVDAIHQFLSLVVDTIFCAYERPLVVIAQREAMGLPLYYDSDETAGWREFDEDPIPF